MDHLSTITDQSPSEDQRWIEVWVVRDDRGHSPNTLILCCLLEGSFRLFATIRARGDDSEERLERIFKREKWGEQFIRDAREFKYQLEPQSHIGFKHKPFVSATLNVGHDSFRVVPGAPRADTSPDAFEVMALGGSTMMGVGAPDDGTIPAFLSLELKRGHVPDVVIFYDGINDVARAVEYGQAGVALQPPSGNCPAPSKLLSAAFRFLRRRGVALQPMGKIQHLRVRCHLGDGTLCRPSTVVSGRQLSFFRRLLYPCLDLGG